MPLAAFRTRLPSKRTCSTTHHGHAPWEFLGVNTIAQPDCDSCQWFSKTLFWTSTLRAFFNSKRFFTVHRLAAVGGVPIVPAAPVSMNSVVATTQYSPCAPGSAAVNQVFGRAGYRLPLDPDDAFRRGRHGSLRPRPSSARTCSEPCAVRPHGNCRHPPAARRPSRPTRTHHRASTGSGSATTSVARNSCGEP